MSNQQKEHLSPRTSTNNRNSSHHHSPPKPQPAISSPSSAVTATAGTSTDGGILWSIEDGVRPSALTASTTNSKHEQQQHDSSKNLFGSPLSDKNNSSGVVSGGFLNFAPKNNYRSPSSSSAMTNNNNNNIHRTASTTTGNNNNLILIDQSEPLKPLRGFLTDWASSKARLFSMNNNSDSIINDQFQQQQSTQQTNNSFSRQNIINICSNLGIETIEEFCYFPSTKISEASAKTMLPAPSQQQRQSSSSLSPNNNSSSRRSDTKNDNNNNFTAIPSVDPVIVYLAITDAHRELKRVGAHVDWIMRLKPLYETYFPQKTSQLPLLLQAYSGEEEALWRSVREKYEHEFAVAAAVLDVQSQHDHARSNRNDSDANDDNNNYSNSGRRPQNAEQLEAKIQEHEQTITMLQQLYSQSQEDLRALATEYNEGMSKTTERAEKAEAEVGKLRLVNVEQLEWIKVLEQRLSTATTANNNNNNRSPSTRSSVASPLAAKIMAQSNNNFQQGGAGGSALRSPSSTLAGQHLNNHSAAATFSRHQQLRVKLTDFYHEYDPSRIPEVDAVIEQWSGKEVELEKLLETPPTRM